MSVRIQSLLPSLAILLLSGAAAAQDGDVNAGKQLYDSRMCGLCHTRAGEAGPMAQVGGSLDGLAARRSADWIMRYLKSPKSVIPTSEMPPTELTDQQITDLIAFLLSH